jgi:hypothetical protein
MARGLVQSAGPESLGMGVERAALAVGHDAEGVPLGEGDPVDAHVDETPRPRLEVLPTTGDMSERSSRTQAKTSQSHRASDKAKNLLRHLGQNSLHLMASSPVCAIERRCIRPHLQVAA